MCVQETEVNPKYTTPLKEYSVKYTTVATRGGSLKPTSLDALKIRGRTVDRRVAETQMF